jgi:hypothetical protein
MYFILYYCITDLPLFQTLLQEQSPSHLTSDYNYRRDRMDADWRQRHTKMIVQQF